jgi:hypothetical protein
MTLTMGEWSGKWSASDRRVESKLHLEGQAFSSGKGKMEGRFKGTWHVQHHHDWFLAWKSLRGVLRGLYEIPICLNMKG